MLGQQGIRYLGIVLGDELGQEFADLESLIQQPLDMLWQGEFL